jgi:hypothetical protein
MQFKITKLGETCFLVSVLAGQIPRSSPSAISEVVREIKRQFQIEPKMVRFFWPEEESATTIVALIPSG